jgi:hypothetical protein
LYHRRWCKLGCKHCCGFFSTLPKYYIIPEVIVESIDVKFLEKVFCG